ncbi:uncharacterized protein LOC125675075 [Ostrea edulis]|uniref:uncharacterized protein LOC125675075 n=1 Tax=Ostrea edulis TaxID=37623 RepID=UPI0024AF4F33|nr:uncharacterized protein LOC125675075 [Ostrea edulis]XP_056021506.1 uncharacterized protein LOC125675075 [Ostrea edulis]
MGKALDRRAANIKGIIRRYINEGHVTTAMQMKQPVDREKKVNLKVKVLTSVNMIDVQPSKVSIPGISSLHNFQFSSEGLTVWKAYSIGKGKLIPWSQIGHVNKTIEIPAVSNWSIDQDVCQQQDLIIENDEDSEQDLSANLRVNQCPKNSCMRMFSCQSTVDAHILLGKCDSEKLVLSDRAKRVYANKLEDLYPKREYIIPVPDPENEQAETTSLSMITTGWAIKETKCRVNFTQRQKDFIKQKFDFGKITGNKIDPYVAAKDMRECGLFCRKEFLSGQQIESYFSRLCAFDKKISSDDYVCAKLENEKDCVRSSFEKVLSVL